MTDAPCLTECVSRQAGMTEDGSYISEAPLLGGVGGGSRKTGFSKEENG